MPGYFGSFSYRLLFPKVFDLFGETNLVYKVVVPLYLPSILSVLIISIKLCLCTKRQFRQKNLSTTVHHFVANLCMNYAHL